MTRKAGAKTCWRGFARNAMFNDASSMRMRAYVYAQSIGDRVTTAQANKMPALG